MNSNLQKITANASTLNESFVYTLMGTHTGISHSIHTYLVTPLVDDRHVDVINEHCHLLASRRSVRAAHTLVNIALNGSLQAEGIHVALLILSLGNW